LTIEHLRDHCPRYQVSELAGPLQPDPVSAVLSAILVLHDLLTLRHVHRETLLGVPFFLGVHLAPAFALPGTALDAWLLALMW